MANSHKVFLDVRMATFKGDPVRLLCEYDIRNNTIIVSNILPFRPSDDESKFTPEQIEMKRAIKQQTMVITDCPDAFDDYNIAFNPNEHLDVAALAYLSYNREGVLSIEPELKGRANVESVMDAKKLELGKGMVYQLDPSLTNNIHIAILGLCYGAKKANGSMNVLNIFESDTHDDPHDDSLMPFTI